MKKICPECNGSRTSNGLRCPLCQGRGYWLDITERPEPGICEQIEELLGLKDTAPVKTKGLTDWSESWTTVVFDQLLATNKKLTNLKPPR